MPFKSKAQARFMFANHPDIAKEFAAATPNMKALPDKLGTSDKKRQPADLYSRLRRRKNMG